MIRIGVIGENDNDVKAVAGLLKKNFPEQFEFHRLLPNVNGSQLDDKKDNKLVTLLRREFEFAEIDYVLYIRDLDALVEDKEKLTFRKKRFRRFAKTVDKKAIFMLNIYEIEALILADFDSLKNFLNRSELAFENARAASIIEPDQFLEKLINYQKGQLSTIIESLNIENVKNNHKHFKVFLIHFFKMIEQKKYRDVPY